MVMSIRSARSFTLVTKLRNNACNSSGGIPIQFRLSSAAHPMSKGTADRILRDQETPNLIEYEASTSLAGKRAGRVGALIRWLAEG